MLAAFWSGLGGELAKHWAVRVLTPAFAFWAGGFALVWWSAHGDGVEERGFTAEVRATADPVAQLPAAGQVALLAAALMVLVGSALVAERASLPLLKLLEGYWSRPAWLRSSLISYRRRRRRRWATRVEALRRRAHRGDLTRGELDELRSLRAKDELSQEDALRVATLDDGASRFSAADVARLGRGAAILRATPREDRFGMPTRFGDILRAAELRPQEKYGLDAVICWYRLWTLLPAELRQEVASARVELDKSVRLWLWGSLFLVWTPWLWWVALPVGLLVPLLTYSFSMLASATLFGDLVETGFDLHRMQLYDALHVARPGSTTDERDAGERLTALLWHGGAQPPITYTPSVA